MKNDQLIKIFSKRLKFLNFFSIKQVEQEAKKKSRKMAKFQRAITGATLEDIMKKRNQKPEVRKAQREQAIRSVKNLIFLLFLLKELVLFYFSRRVIFYLNNSFRSIVRVYNCVN